MDIINSKNEMKDIAIYGAGGFGREVACLIKRINEKEPTWNLIGFFDDNISLKDTRNEYGTVLCGINELNSWEKDLDIVMFIGSPKVLKRIVDNIRIERVDFPNLIAPDVIFMDKANVTMGKGNIICTGCLISCNAKIGNFNCLNDFVSIGHDTNIGDFNAFMTATRISGMVLIGQFNYFGVNSCVLQGIKIGNETTVAAGSAVMRRTKDGYTFIGVPASPLVIGKK